MRNSNAEKRFSLRIKDFLMGPMFELVIENAPSLSILY